MKFNRSSGILMHPSSLPGKFGIGSLGKACFSFIDFLSEAGQTYWQILPLGPTGYGDSPYASFSSNAGNTNLIDLDVLVDWGLLQENDLIDIPAFPKDQVDYSWVDIYKTQKLKLAFTRFRNNPSLEGEYNEYANKNSAWLHDYALFMSIKQENSLKPWWEWKHDIKMRDKNAISNYEQKLSAEIDFQKFLQYVFNKQWELVKEAANKKKIKIIGDIPIYIAFDSVEAWTKPEIFQFDDNKQPISVAGVPPDYFSETGQLWGNPVYDWDYLKSTNFQWWKDRLKASMELYDIIRIDHFRGFAAYWAVPYGEETAINGEWKPCPGIELFDELKNTFDTLPIIAEDLGLITDDVIELRDRYNFPGMKILQFAFDSDEKNNYLPHSYEKNCIVYTGTHDNNTVEGWYAETHDSNRQFLENYLGGFPQEGMAAALIRMSLTSVADVAITPMQDLLGLNQTCRMNTPGTTENNWRWRALDSQINSDLAQWFKNLTKTYDR